MRLVNAHAAGQACPSLFSNPGRPRWIHHHVTGINQCRLSSQLVNELRPRCSQALHLRQFLGKPLSTTYCPHIFLRCAVFLVSAVLYPRTIRHAYSCATASAVSPTAYTVNALHHMQCAADLREDRIFCLCRIESTPIWSFFPFNVRISLFPFALFSEGL